MKTNNKKQLNVETATIAWLFGKSAVTDATIIEVDHVVSLLKYRRFRKVSDGVLFSELRRRASRKGASETLLSWLAKHDGLDALVCHLDLIISALVKHHFGSSKEEFRAFARSMAPAKFAADDASRQRRINMRG